MYVHIQYCFFVGGGATCEIEATLDKDIPTFLHVGDNIICNLLEWPKGGSLQFGEMFTSFSSLDFRLSFVLWKEPGIYACAKLPRNPNIHVSHTFLHPLNMLR